MRVFLSGGIMVKKLVRSLSVFILLTILLAQFGWRPVSAAENFIVNSSADIVDANPGDGLCETDIMGDCTLRAAIQEANALSGADMISIPAGTYTLAIAGVGEDAAAAGDLDITESLEIVGAGADTTIIDADELDRVFHVLAGATVEFSNLTLQNGLLNTGGGGAVLVEGTALLHDMTFSDNRVLSSLEDGVGGAVNVLGSGASGTITNSQFIQNFAHYGGGAVGSGSPLGLGLGAPVNISDSTFDSNTSQFGGGAIYPNGVSATIENSTFINNSADSGGALHSNATSVSVTNSTFVENASVNKGAIDARVGTISVNNSTFSGNTASGLGDTMGSQPWVGGHLQVSNSIILGVGTDNCDGTVADLGGNLSWPAGNDCPGYQADPLLVPLADNGGQTRTMALLAGSPAIDAGDYTTCAPTDQRGVTRPQGAVCDSGAFEWEDTNIFTVTNTDDSGPGSLRQAILDANAASNLPGTPDEIQFNIPGGGVQTIAPVSALPAISDPVVVDGYTQPGASPNTVAAGSDATILIELSGAGCSGCPGMVISGGGSTIRGLSIYGGFDDGIQLSGGSENTVAGNFLGLRADGTADGLNVSGVSISNSSSNTVGGALPAGRNLIASNTGTGVTVLSGTGNIIRGNLIFLNGNPDIDLGGDGITFNHLGTISGPNNYQNYPVLTLATSDGATTRLAGTLDSDANQDYIIDVYSNETCHPTFFGGGETYIESFSLTTDANGQASFDRSINIGLAEPFGITLTATGSNGTSEFSYCRPVSTPNLNWVQAQTVSDGSQTQQFITDRFQEKWFKFSVQPGSTVSVRLSSLPGSAVSLHRDPYPIYNGLINPQNAAVLSAEAADVAFLPSGSLPSGSLPSGSLPSGSLPSGSLPSGSLPTGYLPSGSLPSGSLPSGSLPSGSLPSGSLPSGSLPSGSLPSGSLPSGSLPSGSLDAYASAARRSLLGVSMDPYATVQTIERNTYDLQEDLYVRVVGPYDLETPFTLDVTVDGGICDSVQPVPGSLAVMAGGAPVAGPYLSAIVTDSARLHGTAAEITDALAALEQLAARPEVQGVVIDLADAKYERVAFANTQADQNLACAVAKNTVAREIKKVIDAYRAANPSLAYIVLAGGADVIPFFQVQDVSGLANEKDYVVPVAPSTASEAGLKTNLVQGQDGYGSQVDLMQAGHTLALPDLAVGRLVDTAVDIRTAVNAYILTNGIIVPNAGLITGYDFVGDAAVAIQAELEAGTNTSADTLIQAPGLPPTDPSAWTATQLRTKLLSGNFDIAVLSGHFSAGSLLAADYATRLTAAEIMQSPANLTSALILTLGCHGGYTIPNGDLLEGVSPDPDWAKAFLRKGAAGYISATGYAYGDTELTEYGERLFLLMAQQLRTGTGPISVGQAVMRAKQQYLAETAQLTGIDQKTIVEMTLYGLPMMKVDMPGARITPPSNPSIISGISDVPNTSPGWNFSLMSTVAVLNPALEVHSKVLENLSAGGTVRTTYYSGPDGVIANPFEPIYPKATYNVNVNGSVLRGIALRGGTYTDLTEIDGQPFVPLTTAPTTETSTAHLSYNTAVFYPTQTWAANYSDALSGNSTQLIVFPAQFKSSGPAAIDGTLRKFNSLELALYYLPLDFSGRAGAAATKAAAVSAAPTILGASAAASGNQVIFNVNAATDGSAGIQAVWVLYTGKAGSSYHGTWTPLDLAQSAQDPTLWEGTLSLQSGVSAQDLLFMVQAVGGAGLTTLATNLGAYYGVTPEGAGQLPPPAETTLELQSPPSAGTYLNETTFTAVLMAGGQPLAGQPVSLDVGGQQALALTDSSGAATLTLNLVVPPSEYTAQASYRGSAEYLGSNDASPFTVNKDSTTLTVTPASANVGGNQPTPFVAVVRDSSGRALGGKSVFYVISNGAATLAASVIADFQGNAALGQVSLPAGVYTVDVYFNGTIPVGSGSPLSLSDDYYESSNQLGLSLTVSGDTILPTITAAAIKADSTPYTAGEWTNQDVTVHFSCEDAESGIASCPADETFSMEGTFTATGTATDNANNSASASFGPILIDKTAPALSPVVSPNPVPLNGTATVTAGATDTGSGVASQSCGALDTSTVGTKSVTCSATDQAGNTGTASVSYQVIADSPPTAVLDNFNRANGKVGSNWALATGTGSYRIAGNRLDVQLGGALIWKPTAFGTTQEAFVTLSTIDARSLSQGVILKAQSPSRTGSGLIIVVYDARSGAVRVSTLRSNRLTWTNYGNTKVTFASGDQLGARALSNGTVEVYKNGTLITSVTLTAADQTFFNNRGGRIGLWTLVAPNAFLDDFGGGTVASP